MGFNQIKVMCFLFCTPFVVCLINLKLLIASGELDKRKRYNSYDKKKLLNFYFFKWFLIIFYHATM